ncbi:MAG: hypothetical protein ACI9Z7_000455 [Alteromonas macleodii]|jgi:hypothetical protein
MRVPYISFMLNSQQVMKRTVRSEFGEVTVRETGFVYARVFPGAEINIKEAKEYHYMVSHLSKSKPHVTVLDISGIKYISKDSREFLSQNSNEWRKTIAVALIVKSFTARMVANFFLTVNKPDYPIRAFTDTLSAQQWAKSEYWKFSARAVS